MICENCTREHDGSYGSGRFCEQRCARGFVTRAKREEISKKISETMRLKGIHPPEKYQFKAGADHPNVAPASRKRNSDTHRLLWQKRSAKELECWKSGELHPSGKTAKRLLIFERGEKCSVCGWCEINPYSNTVPIELEHKDGDCYNNTYGNVCLLCPCHHSLTPTFRGLNVGKGRGRKFYKLVSAWAKERKLSLG